MYIMKELSTAAKNTAIATPDRISVSTGILFPVRAMKNTKNAASIAPANAPTCKLPAKTTAPSTTAREAPMAAPDDMPRMYGSAIGFLNTACAATPATASDAPTSRGEHHAREAYQHDDAFFARRPCFSDMHMIAQHGYFRDRA